MKTLLQIVDLCPFACFYVFFPPKGGNDLVFYDGGHYKGYKVVLLGGLIIV